ncbi:hypothetical protein ANSO36C_01040 [Nostoc cf. commune SO-36]|uniref:Uncharacterized protein n=1 Tax=Nostoc cf. commune SO-36 TaxID=449208 RepID=A0ABM7YUK8_NOSCO|nr:hypothetical protein ANSO36C_01040 [Nostoc cf. commune SO-36]
MIEIEVSKHNMTHISRGKSQLLNLIECRVFFIKLDAIEMNEERAETRVRRLNIAQSEARINENKSLLCLDEQTVADEVSLRAATEAIEEGPTNWTHTAAIEMMNLHESSVTTLTNM